MDIGVVIKKYRKEAGMTQEEMANRLGVTTPAVNKWENSNSKPDIELLAPIARLLDISLDTLLSFHEKLSDEEAADLLAALCNGSTAVVTQMKKEDKKAFPPRLYDLTSLQREANRYFGYTAKRTLEMLQELYEEKLVTYPRTDSQFVTEDMKDSVEELVGKMPVLLSFVDYGQLGHGIKRVINNAKVSDHHAILPTKEAVEKGIADLPADKKNLMMLICQ